MPCVLTPLGVSIEPLSGQKMSAASHLLGGADKWKPGAGVPQFKGLMGQMFPRGIGLDARGELERKYVVKRWKVKSEEEN